MHVGSGSGSHGIVSLISGSGYELARCLIAYQIKSTIYLIKYTISSTAMINCGHHEEGRAACNEDECGRGGA